jgi:hypothetical protein
MQRFLVCGVCMVAGLAGVLIPPGLAASPTAKVTTFSGSGQRVVSLTLLRSSPLKLSAVHAGESNFAITIVHGSDRELMVNDIGPYAGETLYRDAQRGRARVQVTADGSWTLRFQQPLPLLGARSLFGSFSGSRPTVVQVRLRTDAQPVVRGQHSGAGNFAVWITGIGRAAGTDDLLFNEIGRFKGETIPSSDLPSGNYLISVQADGPWRLTFAR